MFENKPRLVSHINVEFCTEYNFCGQCYKIKPTRSYYRRTNIFDLLPVLNNFLRTKKILLCRLSIYKCIKFNSLILYYYILQLLIY